MEKYIYNDEEVIRQSLPEETSFIDILENNNVQFEVIKHDDAGMLQEIDILSYVKDDVKKYAYVITLIGTDSWAQIVYTTSCYFEDYVNMINSRQVSKY